VKEVTIVEDYCIGSKTPKQNDQFKSLEEMETPMKSPGTESNFLFKAVEKDSAWFGGETT
jgi:hypothetical protein